jgi:glutaredoxin
MTIYPTFERTTLHTIYSKPACPFCDQAKCLLEQHQLPYQEVVLDVGQPKIDGMQYITKDALLAVIPTARTMPQIIYSTETGMEVIGGYGDLKRTLQLGKASA